MTQAFAAGMQAMYSGDDTLGSHDRMVHAYGAVADHRSVWLPTVQSLMGLAALQAGDFAFMDRVLTLCDRPDMRANPLAVLCSVIRAVADVVVTGAAPGALAALERRFTDLTRCHIFYTCACSLLAAHELFDIGDAGASRFAGHLLDLPATGPVVQAEAELLRCRLAVTVGRPPAAEPVLDLVRCVADNGRPCNAAVLALRLARDLQRVGSAAEAAVLRQWAVRQLPEPGRRTATERRWCERTDPEVMAGPGHPGGGGPVSFGAPAPAARSVRCRIRLLQPVVSVEVDGHEVPFADSQVRLLTCLVVNHPQPLHIEQLGDLMWPEVDLPQVRARLNSLLYRVRRLIPDVDDIIERVGDLIGLRSETCAVDVVELRAALAVGGEVARTALASVASNLCPAQFPYEEHLIEALSPPGRRMDRARPVRDRMGGGDRRRTRRCRIRARRGVG